MGDRYLDRLLVNERNKLTGEPTSTLTEAERQHLLRTGHRLDGKTDPEPEPTPARPEGVIGYIILEKIDDWLTIHLDAFYTDYRDASKELSSYRLDGNEAILVECRELDE